MRLRRFTLGFACGVASLSGGIARAAPPPIPLPVQAPAAMPAVPAAHRLFGLLEATNGKTLLLLLRNGRTLTVDATQAYARARVSAPLYRRKPTIVEGTFAADGTFLATAVKRAAPRVTSWGIDR